MSADMMHSMAFDIRREVLTEAINTIASGSSMGSWHIVQVIDMATHFMVLAETRHSYPWFENDIVERFGPKPLKDGEASD